MSFNSSLLSIDAMSLIENVIVASQNPDLINISLRNELELEERMKKVDSVGLSLAKP